MGRKWNAEARNTALLFSLSAIAFLLLARARAALLQPQRRGGGGGGTLAADALLAALDRFLLDGRDLLDLAATRRNMVLLCHAILLLILRDAGLLGGPARRRAAATTGCAVVAAAADAEAAATWVAPAPASEAQAAKEPAATSKQIVLVEQATTNHLAGGHDRAAVVDLEQVQAAVTASATTDGKESELGRRAIVVADNDDGNASTVAEQTEEVELADDRRIEEFIARQWSSIRQESLQHLVRSSSVSVSQQASGDTNMLA